MNFKVIQQFLAGKENEYECEDKIIILDDYICILDGATSKSELRFDSKKSGLIIGEIIENEFRNIPPDFNLEDLIQTLTDSIRRFYVHRNLYDHMKNNPVDRLSASMVIYSNYYNEVWIIGDCQCMIGKTNYTNNKLIDTILANTRAFFLETEILKGKTINELRKNDTGRDFILPLLKEQARFQNTKLNSKYSYSVIDGFEINLKDVKRIKVNGKSIVLASDGYPKLFDTLEDSENYLNFIIKNDPLCFRLFKSTKGVSINANSFDDRAYIKIEI